MRKFMNDVKCKIYMSMFILTFVICATIFTKNNVVHAENTQYVDSSTDFISEQMTIPSDDTVPVATGEYADWLFAGWYSENTCTEESVIESKTVGLKAWAKFVPADVLTVKCQVKSDIDSGNASSTNMRLVSSVDTLNYSKVGFEVIYNDGTQEREAIDIPTTTVYSRIKASANSGVDYNYSPKVVDTKSEWFVTATLVNINKNNYSNCFLIKPYWETYDGTVVYGQSRYVKVSDSYSNVVDLPVEVASKSDLDTLTVSGKTIKECRYSDKGNGWGSIVLTEIKSALPSVTKYTTSDGQVAYWRNLETTYTGAGTEDTSWYDVYGNKAGEYVIATSADLYGFVSVVNTPKFYFLLGDVKSIVYMVADIEVNKGTASPTGWSMDYSEDGVTKTGTDYKWTGIGTGSNVFKGIFDGQGHTISGINGTNGLFYNSYSTTEIKNVNLTNTYLVPPQNGSGSIVSLASGGKIENVCSDAFINNTSRFWVGGIVGAQNTANTVLTMQDCSYSGTITTAKAATGGIIGKNTYGAANITNCGFSGSINATVNEIGGLVGTNATTLTITACKTSGSIETSNEGYYAGGLVGNNTSSLEITGCEYLGSIKTSHHQSGGLVGRNTSSVTITDCKSSGSIETSATQFGGLVGLNEKALAITDCLFDGEITITGTATYRVIGGIVGKNTGATCNITTCLNSGKFINNTGLDVTAVCRLVGQNENANIQLNKVYFTNEGFNGGVDYYSPTTPTNPQLCYKVTEAEISGKYGFFNTSLNFDENGKWALVADGTPVLKTFAAEVPALPEVPEDVNIDWYKGVESSTYTLGDSASENDANVNALKGLAYLVSEGIIFAGKTVNLGADVTLNANAPATSETWATYIKENNLTEWEAIGTTDYEFMGIFDGGMNSITGLYMDNDTIGTGFFRSVGEGSTIQNLKIMNSYFKGGSNNGYAYVGSVVGNCAGNLKNIYSNAVVNAGGHFSGGIVGQLWNSTSTTSERTIVSNCWFDGEVIIASRNNCGGIFGILNAGYFEMKDCLNTGKINHSGAKYGWIGGFGGRVYGSTDRWDFTTSATLKYGLKMANCLNVGEVTNSSIASVGSIIGAAVGGTVALDNVYATSESYACGIGSSYATQPTLVNEADITGDNATTNFAPLSDENTAWVVQEGSTPILKIFNN